ncbi:Predicted phosphodiesterase [Chitinophaga sp. YR627]|uniref:metallophosphoesterase family protein n=1 Tax=Chitinophaga sp. YR627 TaxID=1881041 RepID=UPI0008E6AD15|nr:metallophosphoesterase family protein [Chitinophaga sp. YR627]SFM79792.1 Predicted phosphodiesterase [Chitinophaga sp. YR627]
MTQLAIISDIHANITALKAVLTDIDNRGISQVYCLGDLVDFAPWGNEVISLIRSRNIPCLLGNHDERIAFDQAIVPLAHQDEIESANRKQAIEWSKRTITRENKQWLAQCPYQLELSFKTKSGLKQVLLVHASPRSNDEYIFESHAEAALLDMLGTRKTDALFMGHTHCSYVKRASDMLIVNCGSVGRSKEKDKQATYAVLHIDDEALHAEIVKVGYPVRQVAEAIYDSDIPDFYGDFLLR